MADRLTAMNETLFPKLFPPGFTLETPRVILRPMTEGDYERLLSVATDADVFRYFAKDLSKPAELKAWVDEALAARSAFMRMPFTIYDKDEKQICGSTSYGNFSFYDQRVEIGWTWLGRDFIGKGVNKEAKFALLSYAFEVMKMERVEIKTDMLNERARAALIKVGMKPEGVLRSHMLMQNNRRRDSIYFGMLREEWGERKQNFFAEFI